jgi:hypothetical protein
MRKGIVLIGISVIIIFACTSKEKKVELSKNSSQIDFKPAPPMEEVVSFVPPVIADNLTSDELQNFSSTTKKIIYEGSITAESKEIFKTKKYVDRVVTKFDAYFENEDLIDENEEVTYSLKIRIPFRDFKKFVVELEKGKFKITKKNIGANDVTEEFTDVGIRLENKKAYLERYKKLLNNAASIKNIIEIEEIIRAIEEEIESSEGRLRYLNDQSAYSTLDLTISKYNAFVPPEKYKKGIGKKIGESFVSGWESILAFLLKLLSIWPYLLLLWGFYFLVKKIWKKYVK